MNWYRSSTVIAEPPVIKPEGAGKKLRRKLQKIGTQQRWYRHSNDQNDAKKAGITVINTNNKTTPKVIPKAIPETPDPNDGKWLEQLRKSGYLCRAQPAVQPGHKPQRHSMAVIPELAHLSVNEEKPGKEIDKRASCITPSSTSTVSISRRYAKTPVYQIGQLENRSKREREATAAHRVSSVEKIAESYRALLESSCAILNEPSSPLHPENAHHAEANNYSTREDTIHEIPENLSATGSPHSDDGTLVAFEEERVSPEPPSPRVIRHKGELIPPPRRASPGSHSLQICLDLLGRELSSAVSGLSHRPSAETSSLQVWVMIEAYERLRDKIFDMHLDHAQERALNTMLDTWIKALYTVHDRMTGCDGHGSESDYGE